MNSHEVVANDILQWLALHSAKVRLKEFLFQQELAEKDNQVMKKGQDQATNLFMSPIKREIPSFEAQNPLIEVNLGTVNKLRMTKISALLSQGERDQLVQLITMKFLDYLGN